MKLLRPSKELIQNYSEKFERDFGQPENAIRLLCEKFPDNKTLESVLLKSIAINTLYATQIRAIVAVARHILTLDIEDRMKCGLPEIVDEIATVTIKGKVRRNYSFATKYCSFHNASEYPIYDGFVDKLLNAYQREDKFSPGTLGDLKQYRRFKQLLGEFKQFYGLIEIEPKKLDSFLWGYGRELFDRASVIK
jgi:hypothetical protein